MREFIEGWDILQLLGEGNFAKVKLLVNRDTGEACAMKEIHLDHNDPDDDEDDDEDDGPDGGSRNGSRSGSCGGSRRVKRVWSGSSSSGYADSDEENVVSGSGRFASQDDCDWFAAGSGNYPDKVKKEIALHKLAKHPNIVGCYGSRLEGDIQYIFLEYVSGGELFDRIEPETGMPEHLAQNFFLQLISAVEYLHSVGIVHRDIKPENILLTEGDQLKLTDFGLATVFRHKGKERRLERACGTFPYMAPEVLTKSNYPAEPSDIWCCGVVLMAMLVGELPWGKAVVEEPAFKAWKSHDYTKSPFCRIDNLPLSLVRKILTTQIGKRIGIAQIKKHLWCRKKFKDSEGNLIEPELVSPPLKRQNVGPAGDDFMGGMSQPAQLAYFSQRQNSLTKGDGKSSQNNGDNSSQSSNSVSKSQEKLMSFGAFSQPAIMANFYSGTQHSSQGSGSGRGGGGGGPNTAHFQRLVKRMTRFWVESNVEKTEKFLKGIVPKLGFSFSRKARGIYVIETVDRRGAGLVFKSTFIRVDNRILVDFRLLRGCGLEFKIHFNKIRENCAPIIDKAPIMWTNLLEPDAIPDVV